MSAPPKPPSRLYVLAAVAIAVAIWLVLGAPASDPASPPVALARSSTGHR